MVVELILRWLHILSAIILVGGTFFLRFSLSPALQSQSDESRAALLEHWRPRWARLVMLSTLFLLVTGLVNAVRIIKAYDFPSSPYHMLVAVKLLLALVIFWLSAAISGRSEKAQKLRQRLTHWLTINVVLATLIVMLAGYMKTVERVPNVDIGPPEIDMAPPEVVIP